MTLRVTIPYKFKCRPYQDGAWRAIKSGCKRLVCCWHRGCGKDLMFLNALIDQMTINPGVYLHCFPNYSQGKRAIWDSIHETHDGDHMAYLDHFPDELIASKNSSDMMIKLKTGSVYCVMGVDGKNSQRARGMNPRCVILSEYAFMDPSAWQTIEPRISQNNGTAIFLSTPNGQNHFYHLYNHAKENPDKYYSSFLTIDHTKCLPESHIEDLRREGWPEDFIQQEYYCSFTRGAEGSYYGKQIQKARDEGRLTNLSINNSLPCYTAWDIGIGDSTAIWIFQPLENGKYNFIHYYENHGEPIEHYCRYLDNWKAKNDISWGRHFVPHDMKNDEFIAGISRVEAAQKLGFTVDVLERIKIEEGINAARSLLPFCSFDNIQCKQGIKCLDFYRKKYNDILKVYYDDPCHDQYSHGCFPGHILISTREGDKKIKDIEIGDLVKTPTGYKKVTFLHKYKTKKLLNIKISNKMLLQCTSNHKIFTSNSLVYADELRYTDTLIDNSKKGDSICQKYIGYRGKNINLGFRELFLSMNQKQKLCSMDIPIHGMDFILNQAKKAIVFIEEYGNIITVLFQKIITFIILMETKKIMIFQTCNASTHPIIPNLVAKQVNGLEVKKTKNNVEKIAKNLKNGIVQKMGKNGILSMLIKHGKFVNNIISFVKSAVKKRKHPFQIKQKYVQQNAEQEDVITAEKMTLLENVKYVIKNLILTNTRNNCLVHKVVHLNLEEEISVYDFEVEEDHCYYANGILVSNSDAFRYACLGIKLFGTAMNSMTPERLQQLKSNAGYGNKPKTIQRPSTNQFPMRGF